ncbi:hypothetical protein SUGI_0781860 [Cryptomeria japonica]|uniref:cysteine-rich repeat secretory protein 55-like n=1 Tax=Cryptomeria japonica TaxID=3369 RepID=UPI00241483ED|nr:cysteine-rich repeat secretory protein 55-like [Cryptomeria japonica]GLJ38399.1 hypothetical protein SUGI_0781860 [Cryptomeria japonica]
MPFSASASTRAPLYLAALLIFSAVLVESSDDEGEIYAACNVHKYSNGSQFDTNLEEVLKSLTEKAAKAGFGASVYGEKTANQVSGRLQCRGDLSPADCRTCAVEAVKVIHRDCPNAIGARAQLEHCFLRYENYTFLSDLDTNFWYGLYNVNNDTDTKFNAGVRNLLADLSSKAPASPIKFALGTSVVSSNVTLYGMEMCWRDMSREDCKTCLSKGIEQLFDCCSESVGVQIFMGSCTLRYEIYPFARTY